MRKKLRDKLTLDTCQLLILLLLVISCAPKDSAHEHADTYICPMHPTVINDKQGVCPVCNMDLVRQGRPDEEVIITEDLAHLIKSPNSRVLASIKTIKGEYKSQSTSVQLTGLVTYDTRLLQSISARVSGRLEMLNLKYAFQSIKKGQKLAEIYSPELIAAQRELLLLMEQDDKTDLLDGAKQKLFLLGFSQHQLKELITTKSIQQRFSIFSPVEGYLVYENQSATISESEPTGMNESKSTGSKQVGANAMIREGDYISTGQTLFTVFDNAAVRVELNVPTSLASGLKSGDEIDIIINNQTKNARVDFVQPFYSQGEDFQKIRVDIKDQSTIKIGTLVSAIWKSSVRESLWIPRAAIINLGNESIVFVREKSVFSPRKVVVEYRNKAHVAVKGLSSSDEIAVDAQFLTDSEGFIKTKN